MRLPILFHLLGVILWSAGALLCSALLALQVARDPADQACLSALGSRLFNWITLPSMAIAAICGYAMLSGAAQHTLQFSWMQAKLGLVLLLFVLTMLVGKRIQDLAMEPRNEAGGRHWFLHGLIVLCIVGILYSVYIGRMS